MTILVNAFSTFREPTAIEFPCTANEHDDSTAATFFPRLNQLIRYLTDDDRADLNATQYRLLRHIERVHHHYRFEIEESDLPQVTAWATASNSVLCLPDGSIRDPDGLILFAPDPAQPDDDASLPYPAEAVARFDRTRRHIASMGLATTNELAPAVGESELVLRTAEEVAWRCLSLFVVAVRAESLSAQNPIPTARLRERAPLAFQSLSPAEQEFLLKAAPDDDEIAAFGWRYESLYLLQWSLGHHGTLSFPSQHCDAGAVTELIMEGGEGSFVQDAKLRPDAAILDEVDLNQHLLHAARKAAIASRVPPLELDGQLLCERQHALNWLTRFGRAPWDEVDIPT